MSTYFGQYDTLIVNQVKEIKGSFNQSIQKQFTILIGADVFRMLHYKVSEYALRLLKAEYEKGQLPGFDPYCKCQMRVSHGLLCAHDIAKHVTSSYPIEPKEIHKFWRTLRFGDMAEDLEEDALRKKVNRLVHSMILIATLF